MSDTSASSTNYQVLARKYRPMVFEDMIGQEALVKTLTNAFSSGRIAHAFMLTGVRGIGKTTTARLLARALNYEGPHDGPSVKLDPPGLHCEAINSSSHMDVMEMDAASRTGVGDIREILDSVRYAPVSARYKVYIIDEVHMLSTAAFNALLKTLEEPPDHAKFIFATTEIRKIPITVLSRCQRFDLRRVGAKELAAHLAAICAKEGAKVSEEGLAMIARAAEGSVRDGLSLLDQAIVHADKNTEISAENIRTMLGLADRTRVLDLFALAASGDAKAALVETRRQYEDGADPSLVVRDLLEICHQVSRAKVLGQDGEYDTSGDQIERLIALGETLSMGQITRLWQILMKSHDDVRTAPDPMAALEMAVLRLTVAGKLPPPEQAAALIAALEGLPKSGPSEPAPTSAPQNPGHKAAHAGPTPAMAVGDSAQPGPAPAPDTPALHIATLEALVDTMPRSETDLKYEVRKFLRPILFETGKIEFEPAPGARDDLALRLSKYLKTATGKTWLVSPSQNAKGAPSLRERDLERRARQEEFEKNHPAVKLAHELFPGVKIEFKQTEPISNVTFADFGEKEDQDQ
ncbi:MAG TPA: DNA polymerase III subunit gamma/tau [Hellea balneolensis]|uniref:DNA polymerase III subunit gamma/tau n=1 Tax=Hellea balneolensis TaxID=287478 RepID=A0A7C5QS73_9PROT|nr:DNA polymerase III subunit gamma/tau [Hellea balneolensis]